MILMSSAKPRSRQRSCIAPSVFTQRYCRLSPRNLQGSLTCRLVIRMAPLIINLNNNVIVKDWRNYWAWGQVQDVSTTSLLVNFDIPLHSAQWIPFDRVFLPNYSPCSEACGEQHHTVCLFAAVRRAENGPFIWQRVKNYKTDMANPSNNIWVTAETERDGNKQWQMIPHFRTFRYECCREPSMQDVFPGRPVTFMTFQKMEYEQADIGVVYMERLFDPSFNRCIGQVNSDMACVVISRNKVILVGIDNYEMCWSKTISTLAEIHRLSYEEWHAMVPAAQNNAPRWSTVGAIIKDIDKVNRASLSLPKKPRLISAESDATITSEGLVLNVLVEIFSHVDTVTQTRLRRVCEKWNNVLNHEYAKNQVYLDQASRGNDDDSGFLSLSAPGNVWYAGSLTTEYRFQKAINSINRYPHTFRLANMQLTTNQLLAVLCPLNTSYTTIKPGMLILDGCVILVASNIEAHVDFLSTFTELACMFSIANLVVTKNVCFEYTTQRHLKILSGSVILKSFNNLIERLSKH
ncbi:uncharacterized protein LOC129598095 [Paramacrobiotus metropolitanus]|uniref:uncharacterized protein LOC129598095 n=1 Tax=Paramacrobiotus metropolitanus TaxID=2943436 RepID=UPI00244654B2|nr:uncharacterized protein LOC129598095 [Paramacrobiotus metropolitanus]